VHFLDRPELNRADKQVIRLHEIFIQAYDDEYDALALAGQVGLLKADIERYPKLRNTWWSILEESAKEKQLRRLVDTALRDPTSTNWHDQLREVIAIPSGPVVKAQRVKAQETKQHRRDAGKLPKVGARAQLWDVGKTLKVRFLDGSPVLQTRVIDAAIQWLEYANLKLEVGDDKKAPVRISFLQPGSWAYQGKDCLTAPASEPTVNFGWLKDDSPQKEIERVVLHEFGHVLGLQHEHGNPASTLRWNRQKVYEQLGAPPNHWSREVVDRNIFTIWPPAYFPVHKVFDRESIMMFELQADFFVDKKAITRNGQLSALDKQFVAALYPLRSAGR
jgi:hypothetical protein